MNRFAFICRKYPAKALHFDSDINECNLVETQQYDDKENEFIDYKRLFPKNTKIVFMMALSRFFNRFPSMHYRMESWLVISNERSHIIYPEMQNSFDIWNQLYHVSVEQGIEIQVIILDKDDFLTDMRILIDNRLQEQYFEVMEFMNSCQNIETKDFFDRLKASQEQCSLKRACYYTMSERFVPYNIIKKQRFYVSWLAKKAYQVYVDFLSNSYNSNSNSFLLSQMIEPIPSLMSILLLNPKKKVETNPAEDEEDDESSGWSRGQS
jgi:hypothetical protein